MSSSNTWDEVWAEYDARQPQTAVPEARPQVPAQPRFRRGIGQAGLAMLALLFCLAGLSFTEYSANARLPTEEPVQLQRVTMVVIGVAGEAEGGESPALNPQALTQLAEATPIAGEAPALQAEAPAPQASAAPPAPSGRRLGQGSRSPRQAAAMRASRQRAGLQPVSNLRPLGGPARAYLNAA